MKVYVIILWISSTMIIAMDNPPSQIALKMHATIVSRNTTLKQKITSIKEANPPHKRAYLAYALVTKKDSLRETGWERDQRVTEELNKLKEELIQEGEGKADPTEIGVVNIMSYLHDYSIPNTPIAASVLSKSTNALLFFISMKEKLDIALVTIAMDNGDTESLHVLLNAQCPVSDPKEHMYKQPLVHALKEQHVYFLRLLMTHVDLTQRFTYDVKQEPVTIAEYFKMESAADDYAVEAKRKNRYGRPDYSQERALLEKYSQQQP